MTAHARAEHEGPEGLTNGIVDRGQFIAWVEDEDRKSRSLTHAPAAPRCLDGQRHNEHECPDARFPMVAKLTAVNRVSSRSSESPLAPFRALS